MNRIIHKSFIAILLLGSFSTVLAQVSVDPLTGKASTGIPICTINSGDLAASIGLSYSSGQKVNDGEGSAGMGWSLKAGGEVRREVRGLPDDFVGASSGITGDVRNGWLYGTLASQLNDFSPAGNLSAEACGTGEIADFNALNALTGAAGFSNDTEPDVFYFSAPGLSGRFIFNKDHTVRTIPFKDVNVTYTRGSDNLINQIVITNNLGVRYTFKSGDMVTRSSAAKTHSLPSYFTSAFYYYRNDWAVQMPVTFYSSWNLSSISSPAGGHLTFTYGSSYDINSYDHVRIINSSNTTDTLYTITDRVQGSHLLTVNGSNEQASLTWNGNVVASADVKELTYQTVTKRFTLSYNFVTASKRSKKKPRRAYLNGVREEINCQAFPGYQFKYYGVNFNADSTSLPYDTGVGQDIFGYYDSTATSAAPDIYAASGDTGVDGERYRIAPASGYSAFGSGGSRSVNTGKVYYGSLKSMSLPSGGVSAVIYESADYYDALTNSNINGGGPRVKSIKTTGSDAASTVTVAYKYLSSTAPTRSSGQWTYRPMFVASAVGLATARVPYNIAPEEAIYYSRVEESVTGRGTTVYEFRNGGMYGTTSAGDFNATFSRIARPDPAGGSCAPLGSSRTGYYSFPYAPNTNYDFERGLPLRMSEYTSTGKLVRRKTNTYQRTTLTTDAVSGIRYEVYSGSYAFQKYSVLTNVDNVTATETTRTYETGTDSVSTNYVETVTAYTYNGNQMIGQVAATNSDGITNYQTFKYAKDYASTSGGDTQSMMITNLIGANRHATLIESVSLNGSNVTGASLTLFNNTFAGSIVRPWQQLVLGDPSGFTASTVSGAGFTYSNNYYPTYYFDAYDSVGHPTITHDLSRMSSSVMMGYRASLPALEIKNGRSDQLAYSDFEPYLATALSATAPTTTSDYWSGSYSLALTSATAVSQAGIVRAPGKNYRFSCWAKGAGAVTLTISINGSSVGTVGFPAGSAGTWQYLEKIIDLSGVTVGSTFSFQLTSSANLNVDNLAFYPEVSEITAHAYDPVNGKTADLDSRGNSGFQEYDQLGRLRYTKNRDKDVVQIKDYHYKSPATSLPLSHFVASVSPLMGASASHVADASCMTGVTYAWYVDGVGQSSTSGTMNYTFTQNKEYRVKLVATAAIYGSSTTEMIVRPRPVLTVNVAAVSGETGGFTCAQVGQVRHVTATISGCYDQSTGGVIYEWYYTLGSSTGLMHALGTTTTNTLTYTLTGTATNYVYCIVRTTCPNLTTGANDLYISPTNVYTSAITSFTSFAWLGGVC